MREVVHSSDCATNNAPALPIGPCDCAATLRMALENLLDHYVSLVNSGDAGNWNPEKEAPVIFAREALAANY